MNFNERNPLSVSSLSVAVEQNAVDALRSLIKKGRNLNITDNRGWTPLHEASALGHLKCLTVLLKAGARINATTHQGETPFFIACKYNRMDIVETLLRWDDLLIHTSDNESITPLHISCTDHNLTLAKFLIARNANINAEDNSGLTPLQEAVMREDLDICKLLIDHGANLNSREYDGHLAFHFACMTDNIEILKLLVEYYKEDLPNVINSGNSSGFTPLMLAVQSRCLSVIKELLNLGANVDVVDKSDTLALHLAAHTGNLDILDCIFKTTSVDAINKYCTTTNEALQTCSTSGNGNCVSYHKSLVNLVIDSESLECLQYILNCGLNYEVLNCPIIESEIMPTYFEDMHNYAHFGPHRNIEVEVNISDLRMGREVRCVQAVVLHPISFLLKYKLHDIAKDSMKYLQIMFENGFTFNCTAYQNTKLLLLHPFEAIMYSYHLYGQVMKDVVIECLRLMFDFGISVDYIRNVNVNEPVPIIFVYACRLQLFEIIPYLLQNSNIIDLDDLLQWVVHKIFMRIDPLPHSIEVSLLNAYKYLTKYTPKSVTNFIQEIRKPEYESRFNSVALFIDSENVSHVPSLMVLCRSVIRGTVKSHCRSCPHQLRIKLNNLELPSSLLAFLNYSDMLEQSVKV